MSTVNNDATHLARLRDHFARHGALPSYSGISAVIGFRAKTAAVKLAQRLIAAGFLRPAPGGKLAPAERFFELPLSAAAVPAGAAAAIDGEVGAESITLDGYLVESPSTTVLVKVRGDSMVEAGVFDGDLAVVDRAVTAQPGDFVVAMIDGEFTFKELRKEGGQMFLQPHNSALSVMRPKARLEIFGVVRGIARSYRRPKRSRSQSRGARP